MQFSDAMITEADSVMDTFIMVILVVVYQIKTKTRDNDKKLTAIAQIKRLLPYAIIVFSVKMSYFFDREKGMNF